MKPRRFGVLDTLLAVVLVAGVGLNVYAWVLRPGSAEPVAAAETPPSPVAVPKPNPEPKPPRPSPDDQAPEPTPEPPAPTEDAPEPTPEPTAEPPAPTNQANQFADYRGYLSGDSVSIGDWFWYTEDLRDGPMPPDRTVITEFAEVTGFWKAYVEDIPVFNPDDEAYEWFNVEITGTADQATITYHTQGFTGFDAQSGAVYDISMADGEKYSGSFSYSELVVGDINSSGKQITIMSFYWLNGTQYAVGEVNYISGERQNIALVRP